MVVSSIVKGDLPNVGCDSNVHAVEWRISEANTRGKAVQGGSRRANNMGPGPYIKCNYYFMYS